MSVGDARIEILSQSAYGHSLCRFNSEVVHCIIRDTNADYFSYTVLISVAQVRGFRNFSWTVAELQAPNCKIKHFKKLWETALPSIVALHFSLWSSTFHTIVLTISIFLLLSDLDASLSEHYLDSGHRIHKIVCLSRNIISYEIVRNKRYEMFKLISMGVHRRCTKPGLLSHLPGLFNEDEINIFLINFLKFSYTFCRRSFLIRYEL